MPHWGIFWFRKAHENQPVGLVFPYPTVSTPKKDRSFERSFFIPILQFYPVVNESTSQSPDAFWVSQT